MTQQTVGRRERKKAETRRSIAEVALRLFLERGYEAVGVREIADQADVAIATLFAHFPSKEALVFDQDVEQEQALVAVVRDRPAGLSVPAALKRWYEDMLAEAEQTPGLEPYRRLIDTTPALRDYEAKMWLRHEYSLSAAIADDAQAEPNDPACRLLARASLDVLPMLRETGDPRPVLDQLFTFIEAGWSATGRQN